MAILNEMILTEVELEALAKQANKFPKGWTPSRKGLIEKTRPSFYARLALLLRLQGKTPDYLAVAPIEFRLRQLVEFWQAKRKA